MKRYSISLVIREMKIKTTIRYHSYPLRWLESKRQTATSVGEDVEKLEHLYIAKENVKCCRHFGKVLQFLKMLKITC